MRERGLKCNVTAQLAANGVVAPHAGAWIEMPTIRTMTVTTSWSLPMRERGLKYHQHPKQNHGRVRSLPMRERGLKSRVPQHQRQITRVAPHAGAWIEIGKQPTRT